MSPKRRLRRAAAVFMLCGLPVSGAAQPSSPSGRELYQSACAACHGADGRGMPKGVVGFDTPLPDFTDCSFATPEADGDWLAISHAGGPVRAFDRRMPAFGEALPKEQLLAIIGYIRTFCTNRAWPRGELNLPRALVTEKAFPENEAVLTVSIATRGGTSVEQEFLYEQRLGARSQFEVVVPVAFQERSDHGWARGAGDVALAFKHALYHDLGRGAIISAAGEIILPTGKEEQGLGSGVTRLEPFLAYGQILPRDTFLQAQAGVELSTDTDKSAHETFWRVATGRSLLAPGFGRAWTPMLEVLGAREIESGAPTHWDVVPQLQVSLSRRQHVLLNAGVRIPVNERRDRGLQFITYVLWDWFDGGLFEGWR